MPKKPVVAYGEFNIPGTTVKMQKLLGRQEDVPPILDSYMFRQDLVEEMAFAVSQGMNTMLVGGSGVGKSSLIEQLAAQLNRPLIRINVHGESDTSVLIGRVIARRRGVTVVIRGGQIHCDWGKMEIVLPAVSDDQYKHLALYIDGLLDHECAHLLYTEGDLVLGLAKDIEAKVPGSELRKEVWNVVEDVWVEKEIAKEYLGCGQNLKALSSHMIEYWFDKIWKEASLLGKTLFGVYCLISGVRELPYFEFDGEVYSVLQGLQEEVAAGRLVTSSAEALVVADGLVKKLPVESDSKTENTVDIESFVNAKLRVDLQSVVDSEEGPPEYQVFSTEFDQDAGVVTSVNSGQLMKAYAKTKQSLSGYIGTMAIALERALQAQVEAQWVPGARRGRKLDRRGMNRWIMGSDDDRIYKRLELGEKLDTAICLLWDCSGSMGYGETNGYLAKAALARIAAVAFHECLLQVGIPHEVLGFNTPVEAPIGLKKLVRKAKESGEDLSRYSRTDEIDNRMVFTTYDQVDGRAIAHITGYGCNRDGECVLWAAKRLAARTEKRKILIVGSDGQPQGARYAGTEQRYLREVVDQVTQAGIEVIGIGIMDESVKRYYHQWVVIKEVKDLPRVLMGQLTKLLLGGSANGRSKRRGRGVSVSGGG